MLFPGIIDKGYQDHRRHMPNGTQEMCGSKLKLMDRVKVAASQKT